MCFNAICIESQNPPGVKRDYKPIRKKIEKSIQSLNYFNLPLRQM